ncbi:MAG: DUF2510 domain-containing protein [Propionibacteriaceae bacterium]
MSMVGWYPDPGGVPGRYRYWDGAAWSDVTVADPREPAPSASASAAPAARTLRGGVVLGVIALVVLLAVGLVVVQRVQASSDPPIVPYSTGSSSGWDDASPSPTPSSRVTATPTPSPTAPLVPCAVGKPNVRAPHPDDGRVHGGNLSFAEVTTFRPAGNEERFSFAHDVTQQTLVVNHEPTWLAQLAVGQVLRADGFTGNARATAESIAQCLITTDMYQPYEPTRTDVHSGRVRIDGERGWKIETRVTVQEDGLPFAGDDVVIIVVPDGDDWSLFFGAVPIGDQRLGQVLDSTVADLRVG